MIITRFLLGVGIGADYPISATLVAEFASRKDRGKHGTSLASMWFVGAVAVYILGLAAQPLGDWAWRALLLLGAVFALIVFLFRMKLPESPRWLIAHGREAEALAVMQKVSGDPNITIPEVSRQDTGGRGVMRLGDVLHGRLGRNLLFVCGFWFCYATRTTGSRCTPRRS